MSQKSEILKVLKDGYTKVQATFRDGIINRNRYLGRRMRYCGHCGVGVGIMDRKQYATRYIYGKGLCPTCGMQVHRGG